MRKAIMVLLSLVLALSLGTAAFAADSTGEGTTPIGVYARYVRDIAGEYTASIESGKAAVTLPDGAAITVTGAPRDAWTLVVFPIPESEKEAWKWLADSLTNTGTLVRAYEIYFLDAAGNRFNADGAVITITAPSANGTLTACSVNIHGTSKALTAAGNTDTITFTTNGSYYYVLTEAGAAQPDEPEQPLNPENPSELQPPNPAGVPKTGDQSNVLWIILVSISGSAAIVLFVLGRRKEQKIS